MQNLFYSPADAEMIPFLSRVFVIKNIFMAFLISLCVYTWFYMPFPFESALFSMPKDAQPLLFSLLAWLQIRVVYDL